MLRCALLAAALIAAVLAPSVHAEQKQPIDRADQLPVHSYAVPKAPTEMLKDEPALLALAEAVRADLEADLLTYEIRDAAALRAYYRGLSQIAVFQHRLDRALEYKEKARQLEEKPAAKALSGLTLGPLVAAEKAQPDGAAQAFSTALADELARVPYETAQAKLKSMRQGWQVISPAFLESRVARIDPAAAGGRLSQGLALELLNTGFLLQRVLPYRDELVRQISAMIEAHNVEKPDIWPARDVSLEARSELTPVAVAIWDTGVDCDVFPGRLWTNEKEIPGNGTDDDGNGYVDDVHGIAWSWEGEPTAGCLRPMALSEAELARAKQNITGYLDVQQGVDSPKAQDVKRLLAGLSKDEIKQLMDSMHWYAIYGHGTHVAGIAVRGNPAARILVVRTGFSDRLPPPPPTSAWATGFARMVDRSVAYYRQAGVRVVNMSWGFSHGEFEHNLELNGVCATAEERHQLAMQYFDAIKTALRSAIMAAPEILFVAGAGNSDEDNRFNEFVPASLELPNLIAVAAVDRGGDEWSRTSFGKADLYANGSAVESVVPGGEKQIRSGTSMASPQVVNLAAKLFAVYPRLSAVEVKKLILDGTDGKDVSEGRSIRLLNEARSFELARAGNHSVRPRASP